MFLVARLAWLRLGKLRRAHRTYLSGGRDNIILSEFALVAH